MSRLRLAGAAVLVAALVTPLAPATATPRSPHLSLVRDTWRSFTAMTVTESGMPADNIGGDLDPATRSEYTSPTNIGSYLWSAIVAEDLGVIGRRELVSRTRTTLSSLAKLARHAGSGQFYNWYDPATLELLRTWPEDGSVVYPFASSVDNTWLAAALMVVRNAVPEVREQAQELLSGMDFAFFYDPQGRGPDVPAGLMRGGFWDTPPPDPPCSLPGNYTGAGPEVHYTCHTYGSFASETRMISYVATRSARCRRSTTSRRGARSPTPVTGGWQEQKPSGEFVDYLGAGLRGQLHLPRARVRADVGR